jgi:hypothetical protein
MAIDFYELGKQTGAKTPKDQQSNFGAFMGGITNTVDKMIAASQVKTAALQAAMPQGIAIEKVPEELRAQATEFLTTNKKAYSDASKVLASGISSQSQRYRNAVETVNSVNTKFENLSTSLEAVALKRQAALDDPNGYSPSTSKEDRLTWGNLSNGDLYSNMTFNGDGTVNYTNSKGESKSFADFNVSPQSFEGQNTFLALNDKFTNAKYSGKSDQWSMHSGEAEATVNVLFQKLKPAGQKDMMMGDINYLEKTTGFQSGTDEYENAINGILDNPNDAISGYKNHILESLETNYNNQKGRRVNENGEIENNNAIIKQFERGDAMIQLDQYNVAIKQKDGTYVTAKNNEASLPSLDTYQGRSANDYIQLLGGNVDFDTQKNLNRLNKLTVVNKENKKTQGV